MKKTAPTPAPQAVTVDSLKAELEGLRQRHQTLVQQIAQAVELRVRLEGAIEVLQMQIDRGSENRKARRARAKGRK